MLKSHQSDCNKPFFDPYKKCDENSYKDSIVWIGPDPIHYYTTTAKRREIFGKWRKNIPLYHIIFPTFSSDIVKTGHENMLWKDREKAMKMSWNFLITEFVVKMLVVEICCETVMKIYLAP